MHEIDNFVPGQRPTGLKYVNSVSVILCSHSFYTIKNTDFGEYLKLKYKFLRYTNLHFISVSVTEFD